MIFIYLFVIGISFCKLMSGYELIDVLNIFVVGSSNIGIVRMLEILVSFVFYYMAVSIIIKSLENMFIFYDYIYVRTDNGKLFLYKAFKTVAVKSLLIIAQKILAEVLIMAIIRENQITKEYVFQNICIYFTFVLIGAAGIMFFYHNLFSNKLAGIFSIFILVFIFLNVKKANLMNFLIPLSLKENLNILSMPVAGQIIKILIIFIIFVYLNYRSKSFERTN